MSQRDPELPGLSVDLLVEADGWSDEAALRRLLVPAIEAALAAADPEIVAGSEVSLVFSDDARVRDLNRRYRGKDAATNVLSFPLPPAKPEEFGPLLGDIVLARETVAREAEAEGIAFEAHLTHLVIHGFLHLLGYDHDSDDQATEMEGLETAILAGLGIADPYGESRAGPG